MPIIAVGLLLVLGISVVFSRKKPSILVNAAQVPAKVEGVQTLTADKVDAFAQSVKTQADFAGNMSHAHNTALFQSLPTGADVRAVALRAIQLGGNAVSIHLSMENAGVR